MSNTRGRPSWLTTAIRRDPGGLVESVIELEACANLLTIPALGDKIGASGHIVRHLFDKNGVSSVSGVIYYNPQDLAALIRKALAQAGDWRATINPPESPADPAYMKPLPRNDGSAPFRGRAAWVRHLTIRRVAELDSTKPDGQWLTTNEVAAWFGLTRTTLYLWRKGYDRGDKVRFPPYHQRPGYVPSSARDPETDTTIPGALAGKRNRFDPVVYDRNQLMQWLMSHITHRVGE